MTDTKIRWGIIGTLIMIAGLSTTGIIILSDNELNHAYICSTNQKVGIFESLSKTNTTGYWHNESGAIKQSTCTKGKWKYLKEYCKENNITNCGQINATAQEDKYTGKWWCTDTCDPILE